MGLHALFRYRTSNIGDDTQSYATALHLPRIDAFVDRDNLATLALLQSHRCVMNSWFFLGGDQGPPSPAIDPLFHGISIGRSEMLKGAWRDYLAAHAPIGCRDRRSVELLNAAGIEAYWSGCLTMMIGQAFEPVPPEARRGVYIVDVHPDVEARRVPPEISARAERWSNEFDPLVAGSTGLRFAEVHKLLRRLAHAELVITRRLHVALPCVGFGTPVLTLPNPGISDARHRFSGYETVLPIAWPEDGAVDFDFRAPTTGQIPSEITAAYGRLRETLGYTPTRRGWDEHVRVTRDAGAIAPRGGGYGLRIGEDVDRYPADIGGSNALEISGFPFAEKMGGEVIPAAEGPASAVAAMDDYAVRRVVGLIASQLAVEADVAKLDARMRELAQGPLFASVMSLWTPTLREARHRDLEADWRRAAVAFGVDAYETGRLVDVVWRTGDVAATFETIADMRLALATQPFAAHGDAFHRGKNAEILDGFVALMAFDDGALNLGDAPLDALHPYVLSAVYDVMWDAHTAGESDRARRLGLLYIRASGLIGHGPETALWIVAHILQPLGAHADALQVLDALPMGQATTGERWRHLALTAVSARETGDAGRETRALAGLDPLFDTLAIEAMAGDASWCDAYVRAVGRKGAFAAEAQRLAPYAHDSRIRALTGCLAEEALTQASAAEMLTLAQAVAAEPSESLTEAGLMAIDVLAGAGDWEGAARIYGAGNASLVAADGAAPRALPDEGWIWSGRGVGDDVVRLKMLVTLKGRERPYRYDLDPRLAPLARRALPHMRFQSTPRAVGPGAVGRAAFWQARNGVPRAFDAFRVTRDRLDWKQAGGNVLHGEEILLRYLQERGPFSADAAPILTASDEATAQIKALMAQGGDHRLTLCLAWRSGVLDGMRRRFFLDLEELSPLWRLPDVRWIVVQHDLTDAERALIARTPTLVSPPDIDMRNDFDALVALSRHADGVVAPKLSTRDVAAAAGGRIVSMTLGHHHIEGARLHPDGITDRVFPNIRHVREGAHLDRAGVVEAVADIVRQWRPLTPAG